MFFFILGLDPAGPFFFNNLPFKRLDRTDADFVDVIHTNTEYFGFTAPIGHLDFYPNGGVQQPGCEQILENLHLYFLGKV